MKSADNLFDKHRVGTFMAYSKSPAAALGVMTSLAVSSFMTGVILISIKPFQSNAQLASAPELSV